MRKTVHTSIRFCTAILALALLAGQIEYRTLYCRMMRQSMPQKAIERCARLSPGQNGTSELRAARHCGRPIVLSKQVTDSYEPAPTSPIPVSSASGVLEYPPPSFAVKYFLPSSEPGRPPPDIVIETRNLRI